jgi:hypothetical protein
MLDDLDWLIMGDFNLIRRPSDRNKPGGNVRDMLSFNAPIHSLRPEELKLMVLFFDIAICNPWQKP